MDLKRYRAILREQQRKLSAMANTQGVVPLRRVYDVLIATMAQGGPGTMSESQRMELKQRVRQAMTRFVRVGADTLNAAAAHVVTATAGEAFRVLSTLEQDRTGRVIPASDRMQDAIVRAAPKPATLIGTHERSLARYGAHVVTKMDEQVSLGMSLGETRTQVTDRIMESADLEFYQAERIAKTELAYAGNRTARQAVDAEAEILGLVFAQWMENADEDGRPLDEIVCVDSLALHGQIAAAGQEYTQPPTSVFPDSRGRTQVPDKLIGMTWDHPPNRPNDRSVIAPWRPHWGVPGWRWEGGQRVDKRRSIDESQLDQPGTEEEIAANKRVHERYGRALAETQGDHSRELGRRPAPTRPGPNRPPTSTPPPAAAAMPMRSTPSGAGSRTATAAALRLDPVQYDPMIMLDPRALELEKVASRKLLGEAGTSGSGTEVLTLANGQRALWKPASGEEKGVRTNIAAGTYYKREKAAYEISDILGVKAQMPATTTRLVAGQPGSIQRWVPGLSNEIPSAPVDKDALERMRVFDFVTGNSDRHPKNVGWQVVNGKSVPILIDHGLTFPKGPPDYFVQPTRRDRPWPAGPLSESTVKAIQKIDESALAATLKKNGIEPKAIAATLDRVRVLKQNPQLLAVQNGKWEDQKYDMARWREAAKKPETLLQKPAAVAKPTIKPAKPAVKPAVVAKPAYVDAVVVRPDPKPTPPPVPKPAVTRQAHKFPPPPRKPKAEDASYRKKAFEELEHSHSSWKFSESRLSEELEPGYLEREKKNGVFADIKFKDHVSPGMTYSMRDFAIERSKRVKKMSKEEVEASLFYSHMGDEVLNGALRRGDPPADERVSGVLRHLDSAIAKNPVTKETYVARGVNGSFADRFSSELEPGMEFSDAGYVSASIASDSSVLSGMSVQMRIRLPPGSKAAPIASAYALEEGEMVLPRGSTFKVLSKEKRDGRVYFEMEVVQRSNEQ